MTEIVLIDVLCRDGKVRPARVPDGDINREVFVEIDGIAYVGELLPICTHEDGTFNPKAYIEGPFEFFTEKDIDALEQEVEEEFEALSDEQKQQIAESSLRAVEELEAAREAGE